MTIIFLELIGSALRWGLIYIAFLYVAILVHELGHLAACLLIGWKPITFQIGSALKCARFKTGNFSVRLGIAPTGGLVRGLAKGRQFFRLKLFIFVAAGPAANVVSVVILILAYWFRVTGNTSSWAGTHHRWLDLFCFTQLAIAAGSLFPMSGGVEGRGVDSDGLQMWKCLTMGRKKADEYYKRHRISAALLLLKDGKNPEAEALVREALGTQAATPLEMQRTLVYYLFAIDNKEEARKVMTAVISSPGDYQMSRLEVMDSLASIPILMGCREMLDDAISLMNQALDEAPSMLTLKMTKAALLIEKGTPAALDEGTQLLEEVMEKSTEKKDQSVARYYMAVAYDRKERMQDSLRWLREAVAYDPDSTLRARTEMRVFGMATQSPPRPDARQAGKQTQST